MTPLGKRNRIVHPGYTESDYGVKSRSFVFVFSSDINDWIHAKGGIASTRRKYKKKKA